MKPAVFAASLSLIALVASPAFAVSIVPTTYSTPNGDGQASGGTYNYWDGIYTGTGSTTTDGAALSGGLGKLTDGISSTSRWDAVSNAAGTGDYVGWLSSTTPNPTLTFNFAGSPTINSIAIQMDNSGFGGVLAPAQIFIDGVASAFTVPSAGTVGTVLFNGLNLTGPTHTIQFFQQPGSWTFISEIGFSSSGEVAGAAPEPASWAMMIVGFGLAGTSLRRRRNKVSVTYA